MVTLPDRDESPSSALRRTLVSLFEQVARRDASVLDQLHRDGSFALTDDRWRFTLPSLFAFLQRRDTVSDSTGYETFRRALYASPINATIQQIGAEIRIEHNLGHVDETIYALVWLRPKDAI